MCSGWAASPRQEQDPSVMPQHLSSWLPILKARTALPNIMLHVCGISGMSVTNFHIFTAVLSEARLLVYSVLILPSKNNTGGPIT